MIKAVHEFGVLKGGWIGMKRICRCVPWQKKRGYDPVPINIKGDNTWIL
jgi:putative component of membrane protein insertase Oxa1/YidC/SpoIIIJ protein YidD